MDDMIGGFVNEFTSVPYNLKCCPNYPGPQVASGSCVGSEPHGEMSFNEV